MPESSQRVDSGAGQVENLRPAPKAFGVHRLKICATLPEAWLRGLKSVFSFKRFFQVQTIHEVDSINASTTQPVLWSLRLRVPTRDSITKKPRMIATGK